MVVFLKTIPLSDYIMQVDILSQKETINNCCCPLIVSEITTLVT